MLRAGLSPPCSRKNHVGQEPVPDCRASAHRGRTALGCGGGSGRDVLGRGVPGGPCGRRLRSADPLVGATSVARRTPVLECRGRSSCTCRAIAGRCAAVATEVAPTERGCGGGSGRDVLGRGVPGGPCGRRLRSADPLVGATSVARRTPVRGCRKGFIQGAPLPRGYECSSPDGYVLAVKALRGQKMIEPVMDNAQMLRCIHGRYGGNIR